MIFVLRLLHILSGAFWYGAVIFNARFLIPSLRDAGPGGGAVLAQLNRRKMPLALMGAAIVNVGSGIWLMAEASGSDPGPWMRSGMGRTFALGGVLAIVAMLIGMIVAPPAVKRLGAIAAAAAQRGGPPSPEESAEIQRLQKRLALNSVVGATLLTLAVAAMAVARYVP